jgi:hypothetical protein
MSKTMILGILSTVLILSLSMTSCVESESNFWSTYIPKSSYSVDVIGYVTVADEVIENGTDTLLPSEENFWIMQLKIRNKSYQSPVTANSPWAIVLEGEPFNTGGVSVDFAQSTPISIASGETGDLMLCCLAPTGIKPYQCQISLWSGQTAISYGNLQDTNIEVGVYNWDLQKITQLNNPSGTYTGTVNATKATLTFKSNNILEMYDTEDGDTICTYSISNDGLSITTTNIATHEINTNSFEYIPSEDCVVLGTSYYK